MAVERMDRRTRGELVRMDRYVRRNEERETLTRISRHANHIHLAVTAERPDLALHSAGAIVSLASRRLRQIGGDAA